MYWLLTLLKNPLEALDLVDDRGRPDHGKVLPALCLIWLLVLLSVGRPLPLGTVIALGSLSFGYAGWRTFLRSRDALRAAAARSALLPAPQGVAARDESDGTQDTP